VHHLQALRDSAIESNDLPEAFRNAGVEFVSVKGVAKEMHPMIRDEVCQIGYEAIRNARNHSGGSRIRVEISYESDLIVRVLDNGKGIDPEIVANGRPGHFGLRGMQERAARIGGTLSLASSPHSGTRVELIVPARVAFTNRR
jgi:signal transduction histidine kinase